MQFEGIEDYGDLVWRTIAYVCRYGHQPLESVMRLTVPDVSRLAKEISELVKKEHPVSRMSENH